MELNDARSLANRLLNEHGLSAKGWRFDFDNARRLGLCTYSTKTISISRHMAAAASIEDVEQTLLHEVAHALVGSGAGHGPLWKAKAASIGYLGKRTSKNPHVEAQKQGRAIDAPLEVGATIFTGSCDGLVTKVTPARISFRALTGRRRGGDYLLKNVGTAVVVKAATPESKQAALDLLSANATTRAVAGKAIPAATVIAAAGSVPQRLVRGATIIAAGRVTGVITGFGTSSVKFKAHDGRRLSVNAMGVTVTAAPTAESLAFIADEVVTVALRPKTHRHHQGWRAVRRTESSHRQGQPHPLRRHDARHVRDRPCPVRTRRGGIEGASAVTAAYTRVWPHVRLKLSSPGSPRKPPPTPSWNRKRRRGRNRRTLSL